MNKSFFSGRNSMCFTIRRGWFHYTSIIARSNMNEIQISTPVLIFECIQPSFGSLPDQLKLQSKAGQKYLFRSKTFYIIS